MRLSPRRRASFRSPCRPPVTAADDVLAESGLIEIELSAGHRVRAAAGPDLTLLRGAIAALLGR